MNSIKHWIKKEISDSAYRHGQAYATCNIYRSANKTNFKKPSWHGLPDFVVNMPIDQHMYLEALYIHSFRQGLKNDPYYAVSINNFTVDLLRANERKNRKVA